MCPEGPQVELRSEREQAPAVEVRGGVVALQVAVVQRPEPGEPQLYRRKLKLKPSFESGSAHLSYKRSVPGGFNVGLIGSTCTAQPSAAASAGRAACRAYPASISSL